MKKGQKKGKNMIEKLKECTLCPFKCRVNRLDGQIGRCKARE